MATEKSSAEDAKSLSDSKNSAPNGANGDVAQPNGSKPSVGEIRKRAYKIFQERQGGSAIGDWQKAEALISADAAKIDAPKVDEAEPDTSKAAAPEANGARPEAAKAHASKPDDQPEPSKADGAKADPPKADGAKADAAKKNVQIPTDSGTIEEALTKFKSSLEHGLTQEEAASRLKKDGPNAIEEKHINPLKRFLTFLWGPIPWMIEIAAILSAVVRHWEDFIIIAFMLALNAVVGFWEEFKADNEIEALKKNFALHSRVLRDGKWSDVEAKTLVTGDIVMVKLGNVVPADLKLVDGDYLSIDQSALTGESLPVDKKKNDVAYSGSIVRMGQMNGIVVATGMNTLFGRTARSGRER